MHDKMKFMNNKETIKMTDLKLISRYIRKLILESTTEAGSGHPTSSLSPVELMVMLLFGGYFHADIKKPHYNNNDKLIFSKGHAAPLLYSLYVAAGIYSHGDLMKLRKLNSFFEGHPTARFPYADIATGSLGQGLSAGVGMALNAKYLAHLPYRTYVLLGDSELVEGSNWEAVQIANYYQLGNLVAIIDVNRLGQSRETISGYNLKDYKRKFAAFGWRVKLVDGHDFKDIKNAYEWALGDKQTPSAIIAKTVKGKGVSFLENQAGWHGKPLNETQLKAALKEISASEAVSVSPIIKPKTTMVKRVKVNKNNQKDIDLPVNEPIATRKAYGISLSNLGNYDDSIVVLDAEVSNSTYSQIFQEHHPDRYFEMFIAEQNMVGVGMGLSSMGKKPFLSTFAAFLTRAHDQLRMAQYSNSNLVVVGSHCGVSIGADGPSRMGLEDISMMRSISDSIIFYPCDAVQTAALVKIASRLNGIIYLRLTRQETPVIYSPKDTFRVGGSKTLRSSSTDAVTLVSAGITLHESLKAFEEIQKRSINIRVVDCYSVKPIDKASIRRAEQETKAIFVVEDHYQQGGLADAVRSSLEYHSVPLISLAVNKIPSSGSPEELMEFEGINKNAIVNKIFKFISSSK
jgi:transketolase